MTLGPLFTYREAREAGLSHRAIYEMRDTGEIVSLGDGLYRRADAGPADLDLITAAERVPMATLCLETALARHDLIDAIPVAIDLAVPRGAHRPALDAPFRLHTFDRMTFELGRNTIDVGGRTRLGIYSPERCIIDMIRLRHLEGEEQAWEALRNWLQRPGRNLAPLARMAAHFRGAEKSLRNAISILL
jgi:predicted transcriptional regulator of viral defense system